MRGYYLHSYVDTVSGRVGLAEWAWLNFFSNKDPVLHLQIWFLKIRENGMNQLNKLISLASIAMVVSSACTTVPEQLKGEYSALRPMDVSEQNLETQVRWPIHCLHIG